MALDKLVKGACWPRFPRMSLYMMLQWFFYPLDFFCFALFFLLFLLPFRTWRTRFFGAIWKARLPLSIGLGLVLILNYLALVIYYARSPAILDHGEIMVLAESWMLHSGHPLYHTLDDAARYSQIYGPLGNLIYGWAMSLLGPSLLSCKIAAAAGGILSLLFSGLTYRRAFSPWLAWLATGLTCIFFLSFKWETFYLRSDPFIIFFTVLALWIAVVGSGRILTLLAIGVATGLLVNLKIHGFLYVLPAFGLLYQRIGFRSLIIPGITSLIVFVLPYFSPNISFANWLGIVKGDPSMEFMAVNLLGNMQWFALSAVSFAALFFLLARRDLPKLFSILSRQQYFLWALAFSVFSVCILSAKGGCEPVHLTPFVPVVIYALGLFLQALSESEGKSPKSPPDDQSGVYAVQTYYIGIACLLAAIGSGLFMATAEEVTIVSTLRQTNPGSAAVYRDIDEILKALPGRTISMGYGSTETLFFSQHMMPLLFANNPLYFNFSAMQCFPKKFLSEKGRQVITDRKVDVWLIPRDDQPFRIRSYYPPNPELFDYNFRDAFESNYERRGQSQFFDVYMAKGRP